MSKHDPAFPTSVHEAAAGVGGGLSKLEYFALNIYCATVSGPALVEAMGYASRKHESPESFKDKIMGACVYDAETLLAHISNAEGR